MTPLTLNLDAIVQLTDDAFYALCQANPEIQFERTAKAELIIMPPTGGETGRRNLDLSMQLGIWSKQMKLGEAFDSSTMFQLPNGAYRSPDASWILLERWEALSVKEREVFPPICPDFVVELRSLSDSLRAIQNQDAGIYRQRRTLGLAARSTRPTSRDLSPRPGKRGLIITY